MIEGMSVLERHLQVLQFVQRWKGRGDEKQEAQRFWIDLLQNVLGVRNPTEAALFEYRTVGGGFIDVLCPEARLLIEQKGAAIDLDKPEMRQSTPVTPVQQAMRYADALPFSMKPAVLCTCNFEWFRFYDLNKDPRATGEPADKFTLDELASTWARWSRSSAPSIRVSWCSKNYPSTPASSWRTCTTPWPSSTPTPTTPRHTTASQC